jgi:thiamine-monophosphate kinase
MAALSEFELIDRFFRRPAPGAVLGVGDDAALLAPTPGCELAVSVDMLVSGRHFFADVDPEALGHKTLAVNLSDIAAMGATPRWALLAGALPDADPAWIDAFARGFFKLADVHGVDLVGGDTTRGPLNLCVTILGEMPAGQALRRSGAGVGDSIWVSGVLGDAALALAHRLGKVELDAVDLAQCEPALLRPEPRVRLGLRLRGMASAAIDISDGFAADLGHVLDASRVGAMVDVDALPRSKALRRLVDGNRDGDQDSRSLARKLATSCLLAGGDDYELCFTAGNDRDAAIAALAAELGLALSKVGEITSGSGLVLRDRRGESLPLPRGFDHFAA